MKPINHDIRAEYHRSDSFVNRLRATLASSKYLVIFCVLSFTAAGIWLVFTMPPAYQAEAKVIVTEPDQQDNLNADEAEFDAAFYQTQKDIIASTLVLTELISRLNLVERYRLAPDLLSTQHSIMPAWLASSTLGKTVSELEADGQTSSLSDEQVVENIVKNLQDKISITGGEQSHVITLNYTNRDAEFATELLNELTQVYAVFGLSAQLAEIEKMEDWISETSAELRAKLESSKRRLSIVLQQQSSLSSDIEAEALVEPSQDLNEQALPSSAASESIADQFKRFQESTGQIDELYTYSVLFEDTSTGPLLTQRKGMQETLENYLIRYKEKHPKMIELRQQLSQIDERLRLESEEVFTRLSFQFESAPSDLLSEQESTSKVQNRSPSEAFLNDTADSLQKEVDRNQRIYDAFEEQWQRTTLQTDFDVVSVQVLENESTPLAIRPNMYGLVTFAFLLGIFLAVLISSLKERWFSRISAEKHFESKAGINNLGCLETRPNKDQPLLPVPHYLIHPRSSFVKKVDSVRANVLNLDVDKPPKVLLVTSAKAREGKSTLALNLAASFGQLGKTLLIEVNLRAPCFAEVFKTPAFSGLTDVLNGSLKTQEAIFRVLGTSNLSVISCGSSPKKALSIIKSHRFSAVLEECKKEFDTIILDGPPALSQLDIDYLIPQVDGIIVAAKLGYTQQQELKGLARHINLHEGALLGGVLITRAEKSKSRNKRAKNTEYPHHNFKQNPSAMGEPSL